MPRLTRRLFTDLALWMVALGLLTGLAFPLVQVALGGDPESLLAPANVLACVAAGVGLGYCNGWLARRVVRPRLALFAQRLRHVEAGVRRATWTGDWSECRPEDCAVAVDSDDELGASGRAFNELVLALRRSHEVQSALARFSRAVAPQGGPASIATDGLDLLLEYAPADAGVVFVDRDGVLEAAAVTGLAEVDTIRSSAPLLRALRSGRPLHVTLDEAAAAPAPADPSAPTAHGADGGADPAVRAVRIQGLTGALPPREVALLPLVVQEETVGVVVLAARTPFSAESVWLLDLFRGVLALALRTSLAHERLERLAALDSLTRVYCRRFGLARLREEFHRARREGAALGLLLLDLDHFKAVNDTYGHPIGDRVLERVASAVRNALRDGDIVVRYGGEEFLVVLPGATATDARDVAERLLQAVREATVLDSGRAIGVTVSIGAVSYPGTPAVDEQQLIRDADHAMYAAKQAGRDRVVVTTAPARPEPVVVRPLRA